MKQDALLRTYTRLADAALVKSGEHSAEFVSYSRIALCLTTDNPVLHIRSKLEDVTAEWEIAAYNSPKLAGYWKKQVDIFSEALKQAQKLR